MNRAQALSRNGKEQGFTLIEMMIAMVIMLAGAVAVAQLVPFSLALNTANRTDSSGLVYAQREMEQFLQQPLTVTQFTDAQGFVCNLGTNATNIPTLAGSPLVLLNNQPRIDFTAGAVANYNFQYRDPEDPSNTLYDVRWAVITSGAGGNITSRRILMAARKVTNRALIVPATLDAMVSK